MFNRIKRKFKNNQKGSSLAMLACSMAALMFAGGVVVDLGSYYSQVSRLQNAADAAAAAGASVYVKKGTTRLVPITADIKGDADFTYNLDGNTFTFKASDIDKSKADERATYYMTQNEKTLQESNMVSRLWTNTSTSTTAAGKVVSYTGAYAYRVDLNETADLFFSKFFNLDSYPITASALAVFVAEPDEETIDKFIEEINANIYNTIPNYYWETIYYTDKYKETTETDEKGTVVSRTVEKTGLGNKKASYYVDHYKDYLDDITEKEDIYHLDMLAYEEGNNPFCADAITGTDSIGLYRVVYTFNKALLEKTGTGDKSMKGIFVDFPNTGTDKWVRAMAIKIKGDELPNPTTPFYVRIESEPIIVGSGLGVTFVHPITINVEGNQSKPMIIAYDGPDQNRTVKDAPRVNTANGDAQKGANSNSGLDSNGSLLSGWKNTATTSSAPFTVNLNGHDFKGVIYAPYSTITIEGSGKINGFIMAAKIIDNGTNKSTRKSIESQEISLPTWGASYRNDNTTDGYRWGNRFDYEVKYIKGTYAVIYDEFHNFTNTGT